MSKTLVVELDDRSYPIVIGAGLLDQVVDMLADKGVKQENKLFIVTDSNVAPLYLEKLTQRLLRNQYQVYSHMVEAGEKAKQLAVYEQIMTKAIEAGLDRKSVILALGGGVVGDLAGFVAATYMRGIRFVQLPTTLLAHDSSVGGKVAINHPLGKNLIGAFHQPIMVVYDTDALTSLPTREVAAGFAEVIKHALLSDEAFVTWLEDHSERLKHLEPALIAEAIYRGCSVKTAIVAADETEQDKRALLNLGHTFGHAFESLSDYAEINHGEAISIGMVLAAKVAEKLAIAPQGTALRTKEILKAYNLPVDWPKHFTPEEVLEVMHRDKKTVSGKLVLVLPTRIGNAEIVKNIDADIILQIMRDAQGGL